MGSCWYFVFSTLISYNEYVRIKPFLLERYFAKYEFAVKHLLCSSDCDGMPMAELLGQADKEAKEMWGNLSLGYTESRGLPELRSEIAKLYDGVRANDVLVAAPEEAIFLTMNALLEPGDNVICTAPGYQSLYEIATAIGCTVTKWEPDETAGWRFDPNYLRDNLQEETKLVVINFPHNPTGSLPSREDFDEIVKVVRDNGLYLFSDEMYRLLEFDPADKLPSAVDVYKDAVALSGMSKVFGLAGLRIGWIATKNAGVIERIAMLKDYTTICSSAPSEVLALIGLRAKEKIIKDNLELIQRNLRLADDFFEKYKETFSWQRPTAGTIALPRLLSDNSSARFCEQIVNETEILLLPATIYGYGDSHLRFGFGRRDMPEALAGLDQWLKKSGYR